MAISFNFHLFGKRLLTNYGRKEIFFRQNIKPIFATSSKIMIIQSKLLLRYPEETPNAPNQANPFLYEFMSYDPEVWEKSSLSFRSGIVFSVHSTILSSLNIIFIKFYRKYLENIGTVKMLRKLYIKLKFQNDIMLSRK